MNLDAPESCATSVGHILSRRGWSRPVWWSVLLHRRICASGKSRPARVRFEICVVNEKPPIGTKHTESALHIQPSIHLVQMVKHVRGIYDIEGLGLKVLQANLR